MMLNRLLRSALWLCTSVLLVACGPTPAENTGAAAPAMSKEPVMQQVPEPAKPVTVPATDANEAAALFAEIKALVGTAAATEPAQCKKTGFGHKPCGGPASYLIYSTQGLDEALLLQKVSRYNQLMQAEQQRLGLVSDCAVVPEPGVALVGGFCVASGNGDTF